MNTDLTTKVINILQNCPQCMASIKQVPCEDYNARFGALIRVKYGIITTILIDWATVAQTINSQL